MEIRRQLPELDVEGQAVDMLGTGQPAVPALSEHLTEQCIGALARQGRSLGCRRTGTEGRKSSDCALCPSIEGGAALAQQGRTVRPGAGHGEAGGGVRSVGSSAGRLLSAVIDPGCAVTVGNAAACAGQQREHKQPPDSPGARSRAHVRFQEGRFVQSYRNGSYNARGRRCRDRALGHAAETTRVTGAIRR
jgi:hypothetical protein